MTDAKPLSEEERANILALSPVTQTVRECFNRYEDTVVAAEQCAEKAEADVKWQSREIARLQAMADSDCAQLGDDNTKLRARILALEGALREAISWLPDRENEGVGELVDSFHALLEKPNDS